MKNTDSNIKVLRDGYGAWVNNPTKAVKKAVDENLVGRFIDKKHNVISSEEAKKSAEKQNK